MPQKNVMYAEDLDQWITHPAKIIIFDKLPMEFDRIKEFLTLQVEQIILKNNTDSKPFIDLGFKLQSDNESIVVLNREL